MTPERRQQKKEQADRYRANHRERLRLEQAEWRLRNPNYPHPEQRRRSEVMRRYGLEWDAYSALMARGCAICGTYEDLGVDHCHETGAVRGILCREHNTGIGKLGDNAEGLRRALSYLEGDASD